MPPPPPPPEPAYTTHLDLAVSEFGSSALDPSLHEALRGLQHAAGERPAILRSGDWSSRADAVVDTALALPAHGVDHDEPMSAALARIVALRAEILAFPGWTGDAATDEQQTRHLVEADHLLVHIWLMAAEHYGATGGHGPETAQAMRRRLLHGLTTWADVNALAATLPPPTAQYEALVQALARYRDLQEAGFHTVSSKVLRARPGKTHPELEQLRARLAQEDPQGAGEGDQWDDALTEALRRARVAYQLPPKRKARYLLDKKLLKALAVPVTERLGTIRLNLARWRRSDIRLFPYVIFVNLPDYHAEVWDGPEALLRSRVVIGNTRKKRGFMINATPVLTARVDTIVYNPYWTVPKRIYEEELVVLAEKYEAETMAAFVASGDTGEPPPDYWQARGYEVHGADREDGQVWVRRKPGPGNALGKVKFLFENRWFVFLHDTPQKRKFRAVRRAFSHGCVRLSEPLVLAELLLRRDGSWGQVEEARVMDHYRQTVIDLNVPVWLVVDYLTARVDEDQRVQFFADVYRKDGQTASAK